MVGSGSLHAYHIFMRWCMYTKLFLFGDTVVQLANDTDYDDIKEEVAEECSRFGTVL